MLEDCHYGAVSRRDDPPSDVVGQAVVNGRTRLERKPGALQLVNESRWGRDSQGLARGGRLRLRGVQTKE